MWKTILKYREIPRIGRRLYTTSLTIGRESCRRILSSLCFAGNGTHHMAGTK
uniref:Uncharacterized protein n=1 Tax=Arabidopsis thaliana TaxID=3702 RepID=Q0WLU9_ARATH|nr:hypothetical protein [Arabidopsis thaliana]